MKWFKFYGQDFLTDPKMRGLTVEEKMCWITLLCLANGEEKEGKVHFVTEADVMMQSGIEPESPVWKSTVGVFKKFENLKMITIDNGDDSYSEITLLNFHKRQGEAMTGYERLKKYREKKKVAELTEEISDNENDNEAPLSKITIDKSRKEKKRKEKIDLTPIFDSYEKIFDKKVITRDGNRAVKLRARLKTYSPEDMAKAFTNASASKFMMGDNDNGAFYASIDYFLRDDSSVEKWLNQEPKKEERDYSIHGKKVTKEEFDEYRRNLK
jgi:hypothetical protein